jgi:hypothetical protein
VGHANVSDVDRGKLGLAGCAELQDHRFADLEACRERYDLVEVRPAPLVGDELVLHVADRPSVPPH